ncbi:FecCD family ABC transporter permease [Paracoccus sp. NSM]|uniref:FecCD family ABC transporter permease n=1 Tax=Paracoccus sp. NSM TaxID=3457784 RepID=UPI004035CC0E
MRGAIAYGCGLALIGVLALSQGATRIAPADLWQAVTAFDPTRYEHFVVRHQRLPQVAMAGLVGAVLAGSGVVLQALMRNPLAEPSLIGISSGASLFTVLFGFALGAPVPWQGPIAFLGGIFGIASTLALSRLAAGGKDPRGLSLILSGALVSMLYGAMAQAVLLSDPALRQAALGWVTGNVSFVHADRLPLMAPLALLALAALWPMSRALTLLSLGREAAAAAGIEAQRVWFIATALVTLAASAAVAICGPVAFVGLVVPHMLRPLVGATLRRALPANALAGAGALILADLAARTALAPQQIHTGVVMNLLGGLFFIWLVRRVYLAPAATPEGR